MGSGTSPKAGSAPVVAQRSGFRTTSFESGQASTPVAGQDTSLLIPLVQIDQDHWSQLRVGVPVLVVVHSGTHVEVHLSGGRYLGLVPPRLVDQVVGRSLLAGQVEVVGTRTTDLRVRLHAVS